MNECEELERVETGSCSHYVQYGECIYCRIVIEDDERDFE